MIAIGVAGIRKLCPAEDGVYVGHQDGVVSFLDEVTVGKKLGDTSKE
jgi:hypothetical protein